MFLRTAILASLALLVMYGPATAGPFAPISPSGTVLGGPVTLSWQPGGATIWGVLMRDLTDPMNPAKDPRNNYNNPANCFGIVCVKNLTGLFFPNPVGLIVGHTYEVSVGTMAADGTIAVADVQTFTYALAPSQPTPLTITWTDNATNEDGFRLERRLQSTPTGWTVLPTLPPDSVRLVDTTVEAGVGYCYRVLAFNAAGNSAYSNEGCGTPVAPIPVPNAPSGLGVTITITIAPTP